MSDNLFYLLPPMLQFSYSFINALSMSSPKHQGGLLRINIFERRPLSQTVKPTELKTRDRNPTLLLPPGIKILFLILQCSGYIQSKNKVNLVVLPW